MIGFKATNLVNIIIYKKHANISSATNKDFSQGEIVNFVQVDSQQLLRLFLQVGDLLQLPIIITVSFVFLTIYLSWGFLAGLLVFFIAFVINTYIGNYIKKRQIEVMKAKDKRMNETNQALNNIKFLKLYSWQDLFESRIQEKRFEEL